MDNLENKLIDTLVDLKENHHAIGIKCEFETEGTRTEEAFRLKAVAEKAGLNFTVKIGGCGALKDIYEAKAIGADTIVAPMIESAYATEKFINTVKNAYNEKELSETNFLVNLETVNGFQNLDKIVNSPAFSFISGVVFGRSDMVGSMDLGTASVEGNEIFEIADILAKKMQQLNKNMIIGGGVSISSLKFFKRLPKNSLYMFETRKIIFDAQKSLNYKNADKGIVKAIEFELNWLKNKRDFYGTIYAEDTLRIAELELKYTNMLEQIESVWA